MKKIVSISAGVILLIAIIAFSFVFVTRKTFTYDKVNEIVKDSIHSKKGYSDTYYIKMIIGDEANDVFINYFDNKKIEDLYLDYQTNSILYARGAIKEKPTFTELQNYIQERVNKYEEEFFIKTNHEASNQFFFKLNNASDDYRLPEGMNKYMKLTFSQALQDILALVVTISLIIAIIFGRETKMILTYLCVIFATSGVGNFILSRLIINKDVSVMMEAILNKMSKSYTITAVILIIIGVLCIGAYILIKQFYHPVVRRDIEQEIENEVYNSYIEKQQRQYYNNMNKR